MATPNIEFPIMDSSGKEGRFIGNKPAKGFCFDTVKRCYRKIGTEKWIAEEELLRQTKDTYAD